MSTAAVIITNNAAQTANTVIANSRNGSTEIPLWLGVTGLGVYTLAMVVIMLLIWKLYK